MNDTKPEIEEVQIRMFRTASTLKRFTRARSLTSTVIQLSRQAIRRSSPFFSAQEVKEKFVSLHYGEDLAEKVKKFIKDNKKP